MGLWMVPGGNLKSRYGFDWAVNVMPQIDEPEATTVRGAETAFLGELGAFVSRFCGLFALLCDTQCHVWKAREHAGAT